MYNHNTVDSPELLFFVQYHDRSTGILRCGSWLHGEPNCIHELFLLHLKICHAKELVPWESISFKDKVRKENMLRISWEVTPKGGPCDWELVLFLA
jgi:hypothetical protein